MSVSFLACSVRGCAQDLVREGATWRCVNRHAFDVARSGYLNLIQPQDRRSLQAGDNALTVAARRALLDGGYGTALRDALVSRALTLDLPNDALVLDLAQHPESHRQPGVEPAGEPPHQACPQHQLVADYLGFCRDFLRILDRVG